MSLDLQYFLLLLLLASFGGEFLLFFIKKLLIDPRSPFRLELSGIIERMAIVAVIAAGGYMLLFLPVVILARASFILDRARLQKYSGLLDRKEPALEFQKVNIKSDLIITLLSSPLIGAAFGALARAL